MREMKDSGVEWIGEIPENWEVRKLGKVASISTGNTPPKADNERYYSSEGMKWIKADNLSFLKPINTTSEHLNTEGIKIARIAPAFTPIVCCIGSIGKIGYCEEAAAYNQQLNAVRFLDVVYWKYGFYYLMIQDDQHWYYANGNVLKILNTENQKKITIPLPPLPTQQRIADYLDNKCAKIDAIIAREQAVIEKLKEYKLSVITEAVTKGLKPNAKMKDSGIEWIGEIPEGWTVRRLKNSIICNNEVLSEKTKDDLEINYIDIGSVTNEDGIKEIETIKFKSAPSRARRIVNKNDTIISTVRTYLKAIAYISETYENCICSTGFAVFKPLKNIYTGKFMFYSLHAEWFVSSVESVSVGISYPAINTTKLINFRCIVPPLPEQTQISNYLDNKCSKIDSAISRKQAVIDKLTEYKKSLIYEVVTGKKEV